MNVLVLVPHMNVFYGKKDGEECVRYYENHQFPISAAYISAALKSAGVKTVALDLNYYIQPMTKLTKTIEENSIDIVAVGGLSRDYWSIKQVFSFIKEKYPHIITVLGGGIISSEPEIIFKDMNIEFGLLGEADITVVELIRAIENRSDYKQIDGIIFNDNREIHITKARACIADIDSISLPDYEGFELDKYLAYQKCLDLYFLTEADPRAIQIIASRSCPYQCTFCYHTISNYRQRSLDHLFSEIDYLVSHFKINTLHICDDLFVTSKNNDRLIEFCHRIKPYNLKWWCQLRVDSKIDIDIVKMMKASGCILIGFGIEHVDNNMLKMMNKNITMEQTQRAIDICFEAGVGIGGGFILGDFGETTETINKIAEWYSRNQNHQVYLSQIIPYPGTQLYEKAISSGIIKDRLAYIKAGCPPVNLTKMDNAEHSSFLSALKDRFYYYAENVAFKSGEDDFRGDLYTIVLKCANCGSLNVYSNVANVFVNEIFCSNCNTINHRFKNDEHLLFTNLMLWQEYLRDNPNAKVAILGPKKIIAALINSLDNKYINIVKVFDINPLNAGNKLGIYTTEKLPENLSELEGKVDAIFIAAQRAYSEIYISIQEIEKYGITIV
ncbi:MAG: Radical domain protein [Firmicutes bacterium]|nr:Radical domain protein [Bacillota bacterium]